MDEKPRHEELEALVNGLKAQIEQERAERKQLEAAIAQSFTQVLEFQKESAADLKRHVTATVQKSIANSVKQIESYMGLQSFFLTGEPALNFHGWPISSDIAQYLVELISIERPNLVVEFGSGTSTVLLAKSMKSVAANQNADPDNVYESVPSRLVTFEHHSDYLKKTESELKSHGVAEAVELVHAPLTDQAIGSESYVFYSCGEKLNELSAAFKGRKLKAVVFVDGPPGATCDNARYPALPVLLDYFEGQEIFFILDDYDRQEERVIVENWKKTLDERSIAYSFKRLPFEKGAALLKIN